MSRKSNNQGRAYEYAWINALYEALRPMRATNIVANSSFKANLSAWNTLGKETQDIFETSAKAAVNAIFELEPRMLDDCGDTLLLEFQRDEAGELGDVRDIVIKRDSIKWEVGLSIKHNHEAVKHSRLSHKLDFAKEWFGIPCSDSYWTAVKPIFDTLRDLKAKKIRWSELEDKDISVYVPLLNAFKNELQRANATDPTVPQKMVEYLIGTSDYYKAVSHDDKRLTIVSTFNLHGTLNKPGLVKVSAITVPTVKLPTELVAIKDKARSLNTVEVYLNNGWQLSFRIHSASTIVEPSLKFDVQFIGMPTSVLQIECRWHTA